MFFYFVLVCSGAFSWRRVVVFREVMTSYRHDTVELMGGPDLFFVVPARMWGLSRLK